MAPAVSMAFGRFAYALLLPGMRADLEWSYTEAGAMNTASGVGFLIGAIVATWGPGKLGFKRAFAIGGFATAATLFCSGLTDRFVLLLALRAVGGATGAISFIAGSSLAAAAGQGGNRSRAPLALGIYFAGGGLGVIVSALVIPQLVASAGWRAGWFALGLLSFVAMMVAMPALQHTPQPPSQQTAETRGAASILFLAPQIVSYSLYGLGYIAYATYIIAYLRKSLGFDTTEISLFWALVGTATIVGAFAWGPILARLKGGWGSVATIGLTTVAAAIPLFLAGRGPAYLSAILFGGAFLAAVAAMTACVRRTVAPRAWAKTIGALTVGFALGQSIGPVLSGLISDGANGVRSGLLLSIAVLTISVFAAVFQREPANGLSQT